MYRSSVAALVSLLVHYGCFYLFGTPLWTETIAEWIMARTPSEYAVPLLASAGPWAKPLAMTGGLALLGFASLALYLTTRSWRIFIGAAVVISTTFWLFFDYDSIPGHLSFWLPLVAMLGWTRGAQTKASPALKDAPSRRQALAMTLGAAAVAIESFSRNEALARRASVPVVLAPPIPSVEKESFAPGLVRKAVNTVEEFYGMSKNAVDPVIDPRTWRLRITQEGSTIRELTYAELLSLPRESRFQTLRCISNTLKSDLMNTAHWSGIQLDQIVDRGRLRGDVVEMAVVGVDGHGDSFPIDYAFSSEPLLALGMNGKTLNRTHGFPLRLLAPRYYGLKHVKWIGEIAFVSQPYIGTWPKLGYTKEPLIHTMSYIDRYRLEHGSLLVGGVAFAGIRGIVAVEVRADQGPWVAATLESPLSEFTLTRWRARLDAANAMALQSRAQDKLGEWQAAEESPLYPNGVKGPTFRSIRS